MSRRAPLVFPAAGAKHTATVIFAHGLGDSGNGWSFAVENWRRRQKLDEVKFILPHAPERPITINGGGRMPAWYDVVSPVSKLALGGNLDEIRRSEDEKGVLATRDYIQSLIQQEVDAGIPSERIVLGGFSQGGAISIFSGITSPLRLGGIIGMSAYLLLSLKLASTYLPTSPTAAVNANTPILMCHGTADPIVPYALGKLSRDELRALHFNVEWKEYAGMPHTAFPEELQDVEDYLVKVLGPADSGKTEL